MARNRTIPDADRSGQIRNALAPVSPLKGGPPTTLPEGQRPLPQVSRPDPVPRTHAPAFPVDEMRGAR